VGAQTAGVDVLLLDKIAFASASGSPDSRARCSPRLHGLSTNGVVTTTKGFEIIVIGGLAPSRRADRRVLLGIAEIARVDLHRSAYQNAYGFVLLLLVLAIRPSGLFGERVRQA